MLFAMAVPSILEAMVAELQKVRLEAAADGLKNPRLSGDRADDDNRTMDPRTSCAEEGSLKERDDRGQEVRRRKLASRA